MKQLIKLGALGILLVACEGETPKAAATQAMPPVPVQAPATPAPIAEADIAVPDDFIDEAETEITQTNYKTELAALEKEVDAE